MNISPNEEGRFKLLRFTGIDILFDQIGLSYGVTQGDNSQTSKTKAITLLENEIYF